MNNKKSYNESQNGEFQNLIVEKNPTGPYLVVQKIIETMDLSPQEYRLYCHYVWLLDCNSDDDDQIISNEEIVKSCHMTIDEIDECTNSLSEKGLIDITVENDGNVFISIPFL